MACPWVPKISGEQWLRDANHVTYLCVTPLHRNKEHVTTIDVGRMTASDQFKVHMLNQIDMDTRTERPSWFKCFIVEMGMHSAKESNAYKGIHDCYRDQGGVDGSI